MIITWILYVCLATWEARAYHKTKAGLPEINASNMLDLNIIQEPSHPVPSPPMLHLPSPTPIWKTHELSPCDARSAPRLKVIKTERGKSRLQMQKLPRSTAVFPECLVNVQMQEEHHNGCCNRSLVAIIVSWCMLSAGGGTLEYLPVPI